MTKKNPETGRFGGPGSSHQDREHPGKNHQPHRAQAAGAAFSRGRPRLQP